MSKNDLSRSVHVWTTSGVVICGATSWTKLRVLASDSWFAMWSLTLQNTCRPIVQTTDRVPPSCTIFIVFESEGDGGEKISLSFGARRM